jgi:CheY-like chemotaxis protein
MEGKHTVLIVNEAAHDLKVLEHEGLTASATSTTRVLIAEDNRMVLDFVQILLEAEGYTVLASETAEAALVLVQEKGEVDLLVTDVIMPRMNGPELYERLREIMPGLKVIYMSGYPEKAETICGSADPSVTFISKPFTSESLLKYVSSTLANNP